MAKKQATTRRRTRKKVTNTKKASTPQPTPQGNGNASAPKAVPKESIQVRNDEVIRKFEKTFDLQFDELTMSEKIQAMSFLQDAAWNAATSRSQFLSQFFEDDARDINDECGYPDDLTPQHYKDLYDREPIATRVVEVEPKETWMGTPDITGDQDPNITSAFDEAFMEMSMQLQADIEGTEDVEESSWFGDHRIGNPFFEYLQRVDILSRIGRYGVLLLGVNDGKELSEPLEASDSNELLYMRAFDETLAQITQWEQDQTNRRYGKPSMYQLSFTNPTSDSSVGSPTYSKSVHWTRCIHIAECLGSSEILATPAQKPVYNRLYDLYKVYGGSAEMYWRGAFPGISLETHPQLGGEVDIDAAEVRTQMTSYMNRLQRYMALSGMTANSLAPQVVDPASHIEKYIEAICIVKGIPKRVFMGSERGELASTQDDDNWDDRKKARRENYMTPRIIVPTVNRLIRLGVLPKPERFFVVWPDLKNITDQEKAQIALTQTEAISKYVSGGASAIIEPMSYMTMVLGWENERAEAVLDATLEADVAMPGDDPEVREREGSGDGTHGPRD